eukprot:12693303-Heterocapsa_arctica.AAC.1
MFHRKANDENTKREQMEPGLVGVAHTFPDGFITRYVLFVSPAQAQQEQYHRMAPWRKQDERGGGIYYSLCRCLALSY